MIIELMVYTTAVSLLCGLAALAIERAAAMASAPRRGLWAAAMVISLAGPAAMTLSAHGPRAGTSTGEAVPLAPAKPTSQAIPFPTLLIAAQPQRIRHSLGVPVSVSFERSARWWWAGASMLLCGLYCGGALRLVHARRNWSRRAVGKYQVFVWKDLGPAVFGLIRPAIVVPRWLLDEPGATLEAALTHEHQHIAARDPALLMGALLLVLLTPWNLPLWWQLRRLKLAMEVDCDTRVLRTGMDRRLYADTLLHINQHARAMPLAAMAIVGRISQIEQRIRAMMAEPPRHLGLWIAGWAAFAIPLLVGAAQLNPPASAPAAPTAHLGIGLADLDVNGAASSLAAPRFRGAIVTYVHPGEVADQAGLKRGDLVVKFGDIEIISARTLAAAVGHTASNARVVLTVQRGGQKLSVPVDFSTAPPPQPQSMQQVGDTSDWDSLRDAHLPVSQPQLRDELIRMSRLDEQMSAFQSMFKNQPPLPPNTGGIGFGVHVEPGANEANARRLKEIIAQYGWPTVSMVGVRGATAAGMIAYFVPGDQPFQAEVLGLMEPLLRSDEVPAMYYAALFDRVHSPQRYGNERSCQNGRFKFTKPVEDSPHLAQRRAALGLPVLPDLCISQIGAPGSG
jgi:hypothetical protein